MSRESIPCWYELSWDKENVAIILCIHKDFIKHFPEISTDSPMVKGLLKEFKLDAFSGYFKGNLGFGGVLKRRGDNGEFVEFFVPLPVLKKESGKCSICDGSVNNQFSNGEKCRFCNGGGKEYSIDWQIGHTISATFTVVFLFLSLFYDKETKCLSSQLMTVETRTAVGLHGGSLGGIFSIDLVNWMSSFAPNFTIVEMVDAMMTAYGHMFAEKLDQFERFRASIDYENGWLNVDCPGNACGLNPSHSSVGKGHGYEFTPHNVDTCMQQLTLLAGLAALHDKARKEM